MAEAVLGFRANAHDVTHVRKAETQSLALDLLFRDQSSVMLTSGDRDIIAGWTKCMSERGGLSAYFEPVTPREARLHLEWFPYPVTAQGSANTEIREDSTVNVRGAMITDNAECLKTGRIYTPRNPCIVTFKFDHGSIGLPITIKARLRKVSDV
jgi:hypothetical protein